ncbi:hypothetical protein P4O66_003421 [Electrophorus voltai]|uniref:Uncharacterized protein n=1 Tax=Electrophorus voltai TaxID=2609070 RepID=A0AAD8YPE2_9TELE|nr:hypothetical protein P4O66_003421 [Electrophorus voltai]
MGYGFGRRPVCWLTSKLINTAPGARAGQTTQKSVVSQVLETLNSRHPNGTNDMRAEKESWPGPLQGAIEALANVEVIVPSQLAHKDVHYSANWRVGTNISKGYALMRDQSESLLDLGPWGVSETWFDSAISQQKIRTGEKLFCGAQSGGGEYLRSSFCSHLRRYAYPFLGSDGGRLSVGVDDGGGMRGSHRQVDRACLLVNSALKFLHLPQMPRSYSLTFVPAPRLGPEEVLQLTLRPLLGPSQLGEVYLRQDRSMEGPLRAADNGSQAATDWAGVEFLCII